MQMNNLQRHIQLSNLRNQASLTARDLAEYWRPWAGDDTELARKVAKAEAALRAIHAHCLPLCAEYDKSTRHTSEINRKGGA